MAKPTTGAAARTHAATPPAATPLAVAYVAAVIVTCYVDGVRTDLQPGDPLPSDLPEHDVQQLLRMNAIKRPAEEAEAADAAAAAQADADAEFAAARTAAAAAAQSTNAPDAPGQDAAA